jgi:hypothetical protein
MTQAFANFEALSAFYREQIEVPGFDTAFTEQGSMAQLSVHDEPEATDMPDPQAARGAMEMVIGTVFDLPRHPHGGIRPGHRLGHRQQLPRHLAAHREAGGRSHQEAGRHGPRLDPSEIYAVELEETQRIAQTLMDCREAMEAMRDYAGEIYRVETGRPSRR